MRHPLRWFLEGLLAAGLGLGALAALVLVLWTLSPYPDSGAGGALRIAADLWLLAHGTELLRADTLHGTPAPVGLTPLLLCALPGWLLLRAVRVVDWGTEPAGATRAALWITGGYLLAGAVAVLHTLPAPIDARPLSAAWHLPVFALACTLAGAWSAVGPPALRLPFRPPPGLPAAFDRRRVLAAARVAAGGTAAYCAAGALLVAGGLVLHAHAAQDGLGELGGEWSGRLAVLLLTLALVPNAAVWAAAYGLGPGFTLGAGSAVAPLGVGGEPELPPFPLFAVLPSQTPQGPSLWAAALVPAAGVAATAWCAARAAVPVRGERVTASGWQGTALTVLLAACGTGAALGCLAALAGGPLGTGGLAEFGPDGLLVAPAAAGWTAVLGTPLALALRARRLRRPRWLRQWITARATRAAARLRPRPRRTAARRTAEAGRTDPWHATGARRTRWAALRKTSGALVPEIPRPPGHGPPPDGPPGDRP
ncbi:cell division protein PerM [Streptomyces sp. URMC 129]|uniref:cell division protein PerM n=1 Tax=Streptomyces sp. URMC 129 TaxID=3423407 RepID=UPI003F19349A